MGLNRRPQRGSPRAIFHSLRPQPLDYCSLQNICTIVYKCSTSGCSPHWHYHGSQDPPVALPSLATRITTTTSKSSWLWVTGGYCPTTSSRDGLETVSMPASLGCNRPVGILPEFLLTYSYHYCRYIYLSTIGLCFGINSTVSFTSTENIFFYLQ